MACDPSTLLQSANCILDCLTPGQMDAINSSILCGIANTTGNFVLKSGDTMTGNLLIADTKGINIGLTISSDILGIIFTEPPSFFGSGTDANEVLCRYSNDANPVKIISLKTRSTDTTADVVVQNSDLLFFIDGIGADGSIYRRSARIFVIVDGVPGLNDMPGKITFSTTLDGTVVLSQRWSIDNTGLLSSNTNDFLIKSSTPVPAGGTAGVGYMFSSTANFGMFFGSGIPALSAAQGSWYSRSDGSGATDRAYINTDGAVGWTAVTTVA